MTQNLPTLFTLTDLESMASAMVKSKLFGIQNIEQAVTLMLLAQAEGLHPATAARDYHIIQNRPAMKADAMLSRFQQSGGIVEWNDYTDTRVEGVFRHPASPKPLSVVWTIEMAKRIGLAGKDNWQKYPRQMLRARVISEGVRTCYPAIATGIYDLEEVENFTKDITPTAGVFGSLSAKQQEVVSETAAQIRTALAEDRAWDAYQLMDGSGLDADEIAALCSLLDSKQSRALRQLRDADKAEKAGTISVAQHKRLEARVKELGLDREAVKQECAKLYGTEHFTQLSKEDYADLDKRLPESPKTAAPPEAQTASPPSGSPAAAAAYINADQVIHLGDLLDEHKIKRERLLLQAKIETLAKMPVTFYDRALTWIEKASAK